MIDFDQEIERIEGLLNEEHYTIAAKECVQLIEYSFKHLVKQHLTDLSEKDRLKFQNIEFELGDKGKKGYEQFTMGGLLLLFRRMNFFDALASALEIDISSLMIDFDKLREFRNKFIHEHRKATRVEAVFLVNCLRIILETFGIVSSEDAKIPKQGDVTQSINQREQHETSEKLSPGDTEIPEQVDGVEPTNQIEQHETVHKPSPEVETRTNQIEKSQQADKQIEFVNRLTEIRNITSTFSCPPFLLISSPMGYGKTRLVEAVKAQLQQKWYYIHLHLSKKKSYSIDELSSMILLQLRAEQDEDLDWTPPERCGCGILNALQNTQQNDVLLLIDSAEALDETSAKQLLNHFIPNLKETLNNLDSSIQLRVMLSGRNILYWQRFCSKISLEPMLLTPFNFPSVLKTVENFAEKSQSSVDPSYIREFASHLMYFTGGHPGCMMKIIKKDFGRPINIIASGEDRYYNKIVKPVNDEINEHIPDELQEIFEVLSAVRRFNAPLFRWFIQQGLIAWPQREFELEDQLLKTFLVTRTEGFLKDDITQRLLAIRLRRTNPRLYAQVCQQAIAYYHSILGTSRRPPEIIAVELLFQKLQYLHHQPDKPGRIHDLEEPQLPIELQNNIIEFLTALPNLHTSDALRAFLNSAGLDGRLQNRINFTLASEQFFQLLTPTLFIYGTLKDGRHALKAVLQSAKDYVGQEKRARCDTLVQELDAILPGKEKQIPQTVETPKDLKQQFFDSVPEILDQLVSGSESLEIMNIIDSFRQRLAEDWEFRFNFSYLVGNPSSDEEQPFNELMQKITEFRQNFQ